MKIIDYHCQHNSSSGVEETIIAESGLCFPEVHSNADDLVTLAKIVKEAQKDNFCGIPFCHTVEGEAMGASINLGDALHGPRAKEYICNTVEEFLALKEIDFSEGRIAEVIRAASLLRNQGEEVMLLLSGPFTILNVLIEPTKVFKVFRKNPDLMGKIFDKLQQQMLLYVKELKKAGVRVISYADSSGGLNILGPKFFEQTLDLFTVEFLKNMSDLLGSDGLIILCPKTTLGLISTHKAVWGFIDVEPNSHYRTACMSAIGNARFIGESCIKDVSYKARKNQIRTLNFL